MRTTQVTAAELAEIRKVERRRVGQEIIARLLEAEWLADEEATRDAIIATVDDVAEGRVTGASPGSLVSRRITFEDEDETEVRDIDRQYGALLDAFGDGLARDGPTVEGDGEYADILRRQGIR